MLCCLCVVCVHVCVCVCVNTGFNVWKLGMALVRLPGVVFCLQVCCVWVVGEPQLLMTFYLCHAPLNLTPAHPNPGPSVWMRLKTQMQLWAMSNWRRTCLHVKGFGNWLEMVLLHPPRKWVVSLCWGCGRMALMTGTWSKVVERKSFPSWSLWWDEFWASWLFWVWEVSLQ